MKKTTFPETRPKFAPENWIANGQDDPSLPFGAKGTIEFQVLRFMEGITWRIIPVDGSVVRITPIYKPWNGHLEGEQPYLRDLLTMVIIHLLTGMILQVLLRKLTAKTSENFRGTRRR